MRCLTLSFAALRAGDPKEASAMLGGLAAALGVASIALGIPAVRRYRRSE